MDPLSDVLRAVRLTGAYFYMVEATHPWSVLTVEAKKLVPRVHPAADHLISYHILTSGTCWGGVAGDEQTLMQPGDAIVFPHGDANLLSSPQIRVADAMTLAATPDRFPNTAVVNRGAGPRATFVCGFLGCDLRPFNPLLSSLPRPDHRARRRRRLAGRIPQARRRRVARAEAGERFDADADGGAHVRRGRAPARRVALRGEPKHRMARGARRLGRRAGARALHERPEHAWTLVDLAREIGTSRTVLVERFTTLVGVPPMQYLTQWRLQLAADQLARGSAKVAAIGARVGYDSEAAFSRAFKRATGSSPAAWRKARQDA